MHIFKASRFFPVKISDLTPIANDVMDNFRKKGYEVSGEQNITRGWNISLHKGGIFKSVLGMKTALNIELENTGTGVMTKAGVGIFGLQAIPTVITYFVAWPVLLTQIWGLVQQAKLDDEALQCVDRSIIAHSSENSNSFTAPAAGLGAKFCVQCGSSLQQTDRFCPNCGKKVE
ncbi:MAG: hypothetical protein A4E55_02352 [Pelotomaculum sp. PtaU1.Bin035]|nr:MAG: hypothetical protein A4E55_02352 [Pelotomaculum sp. PtaU1.Bin035]